MKRKWSPPVPINKKACNTDCFFSLTVKKVVIKAIFKKRWHVKLGGISSHLHSYLVPNKFTEVLSQKFYAQHRNRWITCSYPIWNQTQGYTKQDIVYLTQLNRTRKSQNSFRCLVRFIWSVLFTVTSSCLDKPWILEFFYVCITHLWKPPN